ncbi:MAG: hypothetical protein FWE23_06725 [Chitinivibrionia bacterium]|nr:hypothetical protein [Chitinivibrionia bacterium]
MNEIKLSGTVCRNSIKVSQSRTGTKFVSFNIYYTADTSTAQRQNAFCV